MKLTKQEMKQCYNRPLSVEEEKIKKEHQYRFCFYFFSKIYIRRLLEEFACSIPCYIEMPIQMKKINLGWLMQLLPFLSVLPYFCDRSSWL